MSKSIFLILFLFLVVGCSKNKRTSKTLKGEWKVISYYETFYGDATEHISEGGYALTFVFKSCFVKRNGYCLMDWVEYYPTEGEFTKSLDYKVVKSGTSLEMRNNDNTDIIIEFDIVELTDQDLILELANGGSLETTIILEKQE